MAFAMKALPSSLCLTHKAFSVDTHSRTSCRLPNGAYYARMRPSIIRCSSSQDEARSASSSQDDSITPKDSGTNSATNATMLLNAEEASEPFAGWEPLTPEPQGNWKAALLQVGAGFVLALGFGLVGFTTYQKLERKFKPPAPVATQQQLVISSDNGTSDIQEDEASENEEGKMIISADSEAQGKGENETNSRDKLESETETETEKSLSPNENKNMTSENQVSLEELEMDEEGLLVGSLDDDQDVNLQHNRSTMEDFETAGNDFSDEKSNVSSIAPTSDTAGGFLSVGNFVTPDDSSKTVLQEGVGEPGLSSESNNVNDSISGNAGVSRIVVPELADGSRVIEIVLLSPEANNANKGQTASDTADSEYDKEHRQNELQFSTEGVNISESASAPAVKGLEVDNHTSSTAAPEAKNRSLKETQTDISEAVVESSPQQIEFRDYEFPQDLDTEKVSTMYSSQDHVDKEFDGETTETKTNEAAQGGASSTWMYSSLYVPAPLSPSGATQIHSGKVVVPAVVEQAQEHALKALQSLEVVDAQADPGAICTRREYARWLIGSSLKLARSPGHKIYPAMYIDNITELAYDDVAVEDPDFPYIQGLAEAGLIASNLSGGVNGRENRAVFHPDSYLSRQDLVSWKIALDRRELPGIDKETLQEVSGFIDADRVHKDARPALMADLVSEEHSIIASAFGFTRRFQPDKPTTVGQAAIALTSGEAADLVAEDMARIEAEAMATQAVVADIANEVRALRENNGNSQDEVNVEKAKREQSEKLINELRVELEQVKAERDAERYSYLKGRATVDSEKGILQLLRQQVDQQAQELSALQAQVAGEKERFEKLRLEREAELEAVSHLRAELEVEKKALTLVRIWAEDEAKQARAQGKILEEARQRWEGQGFEIDSDIVEALNPDHKSAEIKDIKAKLDNLVQQVVPQQNDSSLEDIGFKTQVNDAISTSWQSMKPEEMRAKLEELVQRVVPRQEPTAGDVELKNQVNDTITSWQSMKPEEMRAKLEELLQRVVPRQEPTAGDVELKNQVNDTITSWQSMKPEEMRAKLEELLQRVVPRQEPTVGDVEFKTQVNDAIINYWRSTTGAASGVQHKLMEFLEELGRKSRHVQGDSMSSAGQRAQELKETASARLQGIQGKVGESTQGFQGMVGERAEEVKSAVAGMSTSFVEGSKQVSSNIREEAQKLAQRFRN